ncbi:hypothetical protein PoB_002063800 [Plakobranchus ocellatus]|uniref:Uncharacterized protein n=1 Tax=Plakobranchus ocellatus TaxID=259542 RepID=A0AAV3ZI35_9GAST|nr:hypothetical protein PoB_002063800 [Plakobranchus ocellatus]
MNKTIMQGTVNGGRRRGRQKKRWDDNIREWTGLELRNTLRKVKIERNGKLWLGSRTSPAAPRRIPNLRDSPSEHRARAGRQASWAVPVTSVIVRPPGWPI